MRRLWVLVLGVCLAIGTEDGGQTLRAQSNSGQIQHRSGQGVVPIYEGWYTNANGDTLASFGYLNRNYEEELDVPIGPNNKIEPGPADQGQPTHFFPRRQTGVFAVTVPKNAPTTEIAWSLTSRGQTVTIPANLGPLFSIDALKQSGGEADGNAPPVLKFSEDGVASQGPGGASITRKASVSDPLVIEAWVVDDGLPAAREQNVIRSTFEQRTDRANPAAGTSGLRVRWTRYRGPAAVTFSSAESPVSQGKASTSVTFGQPGEYVLRAHVVEGGGGRGQCCWTNGYVKVMVDAGGQTR